MTLNQIVEMLEEADLPVAYRAFEADPDNPPPAPPFICFLFPDSDPEFADNGNVVKIEELDIEIYSVTKDFELENRIERILKEHELPFTREETWLQDEQVQMTTFITEVIING